MAVFDLVRDITVVLAVAVAVMIVFSRLRLPPMIGLFVAGVVVGPGGFRLVSEPESVSVLAELGVVLLLFTIGMEFSMPELLKMGRNLAIGGSVQMLLAGGIVFAVALAFGAAVKLAALFGILLSVSSTALVLRLYQGRGEIDTPHVRNSLRILLFQDLMVVPLMVIVPLLAGGGATEGPLWLLLLKAVGLVAGVLLVARYLISKLFFVVARGRNPELFLVTVFLLCFGIAELAAFAGLSLALGAFLAGLVISESEYGHQALGQVIPFRDVFMSFFFVSIGMLIDPAFVARGAWWLLLLVLAIIVIKALTAGTAVLLLRYPARTAVFSGLSLAQVGEFSFVLAQPAVALGLLSVWEYQAYLAVSVLTMAATPLLISGRDKIGDIVCRLPLMGKLGRETAEASPDTALRDHLLIIGFGVNGRNLAKAARSADIGYVVVEMNPHTVHEERERGESILYGDASNQVVLAQAGVARARVAAVVINDPAATRRIVELLKRLNPRLHIIARTRYLVEVEPLRDLGADEVVPEELETSLSLFVRTLRHYLVPEEAIWELTERIRAEDYGYLRRDDGRGRVRKRLEALSAEVDVATFKVASGATAAGKSLAESDLRGRYGVTVVAIRRGSEVVSNPAAAEVLGAGDDAVLLGDVEALARVQEALTATPAGQGPSRGEGESS